ncbi:hypothetical protein Hypma_013238 [Hypsizygus marmoreus]|uniref:Uncharacterized protein n=1 Tax=Hypsizygus marmoreus TaxID=39966 RepID=A0A369JBU1_HYPMA|nr:hypothetical protein Hypma_013238 [Hypsizygus marmoreus]
MRMEDLLAACTIQLQKHPADLKRVRNLVLKAQWESVRQFEKAYERNIVDYDFKSGALVLVRNTKIEKSLYCKTLPRYLGPMIVIKHYSTGSYALGKVNGSLFRL